MKRRFVLGNTDSEVFFYMLLGNMARRFELHRAGYPVDDLADAIRETIEEVENVTGLRWADENDLYLSFVITNGQTLVAHQGGKELRYSTHKTRCPERDLCPSFTGNCESPVESGFVNHLIVTSEALQGENVWTKMEPGEIVGVDWKMQFRKFEGEAVRSVLTA